MPNSRNNPAVAGAPIPRWKLWLLIPAVAAFAALGAWELHKSIVHPDPSSPGEIWLALSTLLLFGMATVTLPIILLVNRRTRRQAGRRMPSKTPQALTINIPKRSPIYGFGFCILFLVFGVLLSMAGFEGVGRGTTKIFLGGLLAIVLSALMIATYALQRWDTRGRPWHIIIDADGIRDSRLGQLLISWTNVTFIRGWIVRNHPYVTLGLRDSAAYRKALNPLERLWARLGGVLGSRSYTLGLYILNVDERDFIEALRAFKPADVAMMDFPEASTGPC